MFLVYGKEIEIINYVQDFLYSRESYQQLSDLILLVIRCSICTN